MKKPVIAVVLVAALAAAGLAWWRDGGSEPGDDLVLYGNVDIRQISLAFDGNGRIQAMSAEEGDRVRAGDELAVLDTRLLELQRDQARAQIGVQEQAVLRLRRGSRPQEIAQARSRVAAADAERQRAQQDLTRLQGIAADTQGRGVSAQDLERARSTVAVALARVTEQREALQLMELGPRIEDVDGAAAQLEGLKAQLAVLEHQIAQGRLAAPADAIVRTRLLEPGDMATPQRPVYALALPAPKWVRVYASETELGRIRPGMSARIVTDSHPDQPVTGQVGYISAVAEFTPKSVQTEELRTSLVYEVRVVTDDADDRLRIGQPVTVHLLPGATQ